MLSILDYIQRIQTLNQHNYRYHVLEQPIITDAEFDRLLNELRQIEAAHPDWIRADSPTQRVGAPASGRFPAVAHPKPVLSLANAFSTQDVAAWAERIRKIDPDADSAGYVMEPKIDGLTVVLTYRSGALTGGTTRGDGLVGEDITANIRAIRSVPLRIPLSNESVPVPETIVVRGEVYIENQDFERLNDEIVRNGEKPYLNPRNTASGSLRQLNPAVTAARPLKILIYQVLDDSHDVPIPMQQTERTDYLRKLGFPTFDEARYFPTLDGVLNDIPNWTQIRETIRYEIDGIVIKVNDLVAADALGFAGKDPRGAIALKFPAREAMTRLLDISVAVGRTGILTPTAMMEPAEIGGATIRQASLHNFDFIRDRDIRIGDQLLIKRAGDVIPYVVASIPERRDGSQLPYVPPAKCPSCGEPVESFPGEIGLFCINSRCPAQLIRVIEYFASRTAMDIEGLGIRIVEQICESGMVADYADLYALTRDQLLTLPGFGEKKADNLIAAIEASKSRPLARVINALGIRNVGEVIAASLANRFGSIAALREATGAELTAIDGVGETLAESIIEWFRSPRNLEIVGKLRQAGIDPTVERRDAEGADKNAPENLPLAGQTVVVTGTLKRFTRESIHEQIVRLGGKAGDSVSRKTSFVIYGEKAGSKLEKARKLGVPVRAEDEFLNTYAQFLESPGEPE